MDIDSLFVSAFIGVHLRLPHSPWLEIRKAGVPMRAVLAVLVAMVALDGFFFLAFPRTVKRCVNVLRPRELRIVGAIELLIAAAVVYYLLTWA